MALTDIGAKAREALLRFRRQDSGAVAITFALSAVVLFGMAALAVDGANITRARYAVQARLDEAALAAARSYAENTGDPQIVAQSYFERDWSRLYLNSMPTLSLVASRDGQTGDYVVQLESSSSVAMSFARVLGYDTTAMRVTSEARIAVPYTEIAMALDTTGSMDGSKLLDLKMAAKRLVEDVYAMPNARNRVKFSLVPFAQYVKVGMGYRNESWMDVPPDGSYWDNNICWDHYPIISQTNCRQTTCTYMADGVPVSYSCQQCDTTYGPPERRCGANVTTVWNGCAGSRNYPMNMTPIANSGSKIPGVPNVQCGAPLMRLTDQENTVRMAIDDMTAIGDTYIAAGVEWGWRTLSPSGPFAADTRPASGANRARKVLVLMTDGANTRSPNYPDHEGWDGTVANQLMTEICTKAKQDGIEIFTVAFEVNDNTIKSMLQQCAFKASHYFDAANRTALFDAFQTIAKNVVQTRLSR